MDHSPLCRSLLSVLCPMNSSYLSLPWIPFISSTQGDHQALPEGPLHFVMTQVCSPGSKLLIIVNLVRFLIFRDHSPLVSNVLKTVVSYILFSSFLVILCSKVNLVLMTSSWLEMKVCFFIFELTSSILYSPCHSKVTVLWKYQKILD